MLSTLPTRTLFESHLNCAFVLAIIESSGAPSSPILGVPGVLSRSPQNPFGDLLREFILVLMVQVYGMPLNLLSQYRIFMKKKTEVNDKGPG